MMRAGVSQAAASTGWIMLLTLAGVGGTLALACATPFAALAALAATRMRAADGIRLMLAVWAASQAVGFGVLGFPHDPTTLLWGVAIGTAAVASARVARIAAGRTAGRLQLPVAFVAASLGYKLTLLAWSFVLGGVAIAASPRYFAIDLARDGAILAALVLLYRGLVAAGVPAARVAGARARPA